MFNCVFRTYHPVIEANHNYIHEDIEAGTWTLEIRDPALDSNPDPQDLKCGLYELDYYLNSSSIIVGCDSTETVPRQLRPTGADGSIRFYADKIIALNTQRHNFVSFPVTTPSYMRVFVYADSGNDIDFYLYPNGNVTNSVANAIYMSLGLQNRESALWVLQPQAQQYVLDVNVFTTNALRQCNYYQLEIAVEPIETVREELLCPATLPNEVYQVPPANFDLRGGYDTSSYSEFYVFTSSRIDASHQGGSYRYRITLRVTKPMIVSGIIGFDFLANDFVLSISDANNRVIASGTADAAADRASYINFINSVTAVLSNGTFYLDITETFNNYNRTWGLGQLCHAFSFELTAYAPTQPKVVAINPSYGYDLDPDTDLTIYVTFSEAMSIAESDLLNFIINSKAIFLRNANNNSLVVFPYAVTTHTGGSVVQVCDILFIGKKNL